MWSGATVKLPMHHPITVGLWAWVPGLGLRSRYPTSIGLRCLLPCQSVHVPPVSGIPSLIKHTPHTKARHGFSTWASCLLRLRYVFSGLDFVFLDPSLSQFYQPRLPRRHLCSPRSTLKHASKRYCPTSTTLDSEFQPFRWVWECVWVRVWVWTRDTSETPSFWHGLLLTWFFILPAACRAVTSRSVCLPTPS